MALYVRNFADFRYDWHKRILSHATVLPTLASPRGTTAEIRANPPMIVFKKAETRALARVSETFLSTLP